MLKPCFGVGNPRLHVHSKSIVRFADFELDLDTGELRSNGNVNYLQEKPFRILVVLLEHPGELITREQLVKELWPEGTFVDFDQSLNKAVNRLREALGDSAEKPQLIQTLPRRGYRFICQVEPPTGYRDVTIGTASTPQKKTSTTPEWMKWAFAVLAFVLVILAAWIALRPPAAAPELKETQITASSSDLPVKGDAISPDGRYLAYSDAHGVHLKLLATGETSTLSEEPSEDVFAWFPDSIRFLASDISHPGILAFSVKGGAPQQFRTDGTVNAVSPDGSLVAFTTHKGRVGDREIWIIGADGANPRKFLGAADDTALAEVSWTPDGQRLWYVQQRQTNNGLEVLVESRDLQADGPVTVYSESALTPEKMRLEDLVWLPGGRIVFSLAAQDSDLVSTLTLHCNLWELHVNLATGRPVGPMRQITNWPSGTAVTNLYATADGKKLSVFRMSSTISLFLADFASDRQRISSPRRLTTVEGRNAAPVWSSDSRTVFFESDRDGRVHLFRQGISSDTAQPVLQGSVQSSLPVVSPDGSYLLYIASAHPTIGGSSIPAQIMRVPINGGAPQTLLTASIYDSPRCARAPATLCAIAEPSPDRRQLVFSSLDVVSGRGRELARMDANPEFDYAWDLSPDGSSVAVLTRVPRSDGKIESSKGPIRVLSLNGKQERKIWVKGRNDFRIFIDWAADGKKLILARLTDGAPELISTDLSGNANVLWHAAGVFPMRAVSSPDGQHLAILCRGDSNNVSLLENF